MRVTLRRRRAPDGLIVIDDDALVRDSLSCAVARWGHQVIHGADAREVLACWASGGPAR